MSQSGFLSTLRPQAMAVPESGIVAIANAGRQMANVIPLWVGESDRATPEFIAKPAANALLGGETFYTWQRGIPELREALAAYHRRHFKSDFDSEEFVVTGSGMIAIQIAINAIAGEDDEVVYLEPAWPNIDAALGIAGAKAVPVALSGEGGAWTLDRQRFLDAIGPRTKAIFINTPSNPTGWVASADDLAFFLETARSKGLWIIADEIYTRYYYEGARAPSFMEIADPLDRLIYVNTFSKNWAMTGWRMGWIKASPDLKQVLENLVQYSTSGVAQFMQRGAVAALNEGDQLVCEQVDQCHRNRDMLVAALQQNDRVMVSSPPGAFYLFFGVKGVEDSTATALQILKQTGVGLAPGSAFGTAGEGYFRLCYHRNPKIIREAANRLVQWVQTS